MGKLVLHLPDGSTRDVALVRERTTIGRRPDNDICLPLPTVSGEHAAVVTVFDDSFLEDLGSRNGTLVNGRQIRKHFLRDHDEIDIGRQRIVYVSGLHDAAEAGQAPPVRAEPAVAAVPRARQPPAARPPGAETAVVPASGTRSSLDAAVDDHATIDTSLLFAPPDDPGGRAATAPRGDAASLEVLDGPRAGTVLAIDGEEVVLGRLGLQVAAVRRTADGLRLVALEGDVPPAINGAPLPAEGALLARGDEIAIAGTRVRYRPAR